MPIGHGKVIAVDGESSIFQTHIEHWRGLADYVAGNTDGATGRPDGNDNWGGHYHLYCKDADNSRQPARFPNDSATLTCSFGSGTSTGYTGTARFSRLQIDAPIEQGGNIIHRIDFMANGSLSRIAAPTTDSTIPLPMNAKYAKIALGGADQADVAYQRLIFNALCIPYCNTSTSGQWKADEGDLDVVCQWLIQSEDASVFPNPGALVVLRFHVTATKYWEIQWMRIEGVRPHFKDRREPRRLTGASVIAKMEASNGTNLGHIIAPDGTYKWGSA
jgi:hypothetical protein